MKFSPKENFPSFALAVTPHNTSYLPGWPKMHGFLWVSDVSGGTTVEVEDANGNAVTCEVANGDIIPFICSRCTTGTDATVYFCTNYNS